MDFCSYSARLMNPSKFVPSDDIPVMMMTATHSKLVESSNLSSDELCQINSKDSMDSYNTELQLQNKETVPVMVNLMELAIVAMGASVSAAKPIQRLSLHPLYSELGFEFSFTADPTKSDGITVDAGSVEKNSLSGRMSSGSQDTSESLPSLSNNQHHRVDSNDTKNARLKLDGTVVTDADGAAQRIICSSLQQTSRYIRIVAEESRQEAEQSTHNVRDRVWGGLSPLTRRRLMTEEEEEEIEIMNGVRTEIYQRIQSCTRKRNRILLQPSSQCSSSEVDPNPLEEDLTSMDTFLRNYDVDAGRVAVFIDPLDGTGCYAKGEYDAVTILTAIILDNIPIFGIICKPFAIDIPRSSQHLEEADFFNNFMEHGHSHPSNASALRETFLGTGCLVTYGGTLFHGAFLAGGDELDSSRLFYEQTILSSNATLDDTDSSLLHTLTTKEEKNRKAIISKSRSGGVVGKCIQSLSSSGHIDFEPIHIAGAGYKALRLLLACEQESLWFFPKPGTSLWDVAAADALLRVVGGRLTDKHGRDMDYSKVRTEAENLDGVVASNDALLHKICLQRYHAEGWTDDED